MFSDTVNLTALQISLVVAGFWQLGRTNIIAIRAWINIHLKTCTPTRIFAAGKFYGARLQETWKFWKTLKLNNVQMNSYME